MKIKTDRLLIRELVYDDWYDYYNYAKDKEVARLAGFKPVLDSDTARNIVLGMVYRADTYAIILRGENKFIGTLSLYHKGIRKIKDVYTIGISLDKNYWHSGFGREAVKALINYTFKAKKATYIEIVHEITNLKSKKMIEACGFKKMCDISDYGILYDGSTYSISYYSLSKKEFDLK